MMLRPVIALLLLPAVPAPLLAQAADASAIGARRAVHVAVDNDLLAVRSGGVPPDYDYTHGTRVTVTWEAAPQWLRHAANVPPGCRGAADRRAGCLVAALTVGQEIYTPRRDAPMPVPGERPYAGWLSATGTVAAVRPGRTRMLAVAIGVTGRPSLAQPVQDGVHRLLHNEPQRGWAHQLHTGSGVEVTYADIRRHERRIGGSSTAAVRSQWGATLGTLRSKLSVGVEGTLGQRSALSWSPAAPEIEEPLRMYLLGSVRQDWVPWDAFIEGRDAQHAAVRRALVAQAEVGAGYRWRRLGVEYRHAIRGREYRAQPAAHAVGSVRVTVLR